VGRSATQPRDAANRLREARKRCTCAGSEPFAVRVALTGKATVKPMTIESAIRLLAGSLILLGLALSQLVSPWWLLLTAFVGLNLAQSALSGFCPAESIFRRLGVGGSCGSPRGRA
jgi:Protein of unknown function (DUF2892)